MEELKQLEDKIVYAEDRRKELLAQLEHKPKFRAQSQLPSIDACVDGFRKGQLIVVSGPPKNGKCHGKGTRIIMHDGTVKLVEDVLLGDSLMGPDSKPRKVLSLGRGREMLYEVIQRGENYIVNASHILSLRRTGSKKRTPKTKGRIVNIPLNEYLKQSTTFKHHTKGWKIGVDFPRATVPLSPYFLGLWLGDGTSDSAAVTTADGEIVQYLYTYAKRNESVVRVTRQDGNASATYSLSRGKQNIQKTLRSIGVLGNKNIPQSYKVNDRKTRLLVLAGLIDSDGSVARKGSYPCYEITLKSESLSDDVCFLARSLGLSVTKTKCKKGIKSIGFVGTYFRMTISGDLTEVPVLIERKRIVRKPVRYHLGSNITIRDVGIGDYYGFELDGDHMYLLGDFTVTHNTALCQTFTKAFVAQKMKCLWFSYELGYEEIFDKFPMVTLDFHVPNYMKSGNLSWVEEKIKEAVSREDVKTDVVFIDNLDFLRDPDILKGMSINLSSYVGGIVQKLKSIAVQYNIVIFLMTHIRKNKWDTDDIPSSEELRDSGQIAQLADIVIMVLRKRHKRTDRKGADEIYVGTEATVAIIENRHNGKTKKIPVLLSGGEFIELYVGSQEDYGAITY